MSQLDVAIVTRAVEARMWDILQKHLDSVDLDLDDVLLISDIVAQQSDFILKYPHAKQEATRAAFLKSLRAYIERRCEPQSVAAFDRSTASIELAEFGYRELLRLVDDTLIATRDPITRVSAVLARAAVEIRILRNMLMRNLTASTEFFQHQAVMLKGHSGRPIFPDAALQSVVAATTMSVVMESYKGRDAWIDGAGHVYLPDVVPVDDETIEMAGATIVLALEWRKWKRLEEELRFNGGQIAMSDRSGAPDLMPADDIDLLIRFTPSDDLLNLEHHALVAEDRLQQRLLQTFVEMRNETNLIAKAAGIDRVIRLLPHTLVSEEEGHAAVALSEILGYAIVDDLERYAGLTFPEWLRGYAALQDLARVRWERSGALRDLLPRFSEYELTSMLVRLGMSTDAASRFLDIATLSRSSRDLFDAPLVRLHSGSYILFSPALISANLTRVILSAQSAADVIIDDKGKRFEQYVIDRLRENGLMVCAGKFTRDGFEYEYDAIVLWDKFAFLFECKNRSIPGLNPILLHRYRKSLRSHINQVRRLRDGLKAWPDAAVASLGFDPRDFTVIPCVLNSLPFSIAGTVDDVYITDLSTLLRFFDGPTINLRFGLGASSERVESIIPIARIWSGESPSAEALLTYLNDPPQLKAAMNRLAHLEQYIRLGKQSAAVAILPTLVEATLDTEASSLGADASKVRAALLAGHEALLGLKQALDEERHRDESYEDTQGRAATT